MSAECGGVAYIGEWTDLDGEQGVFGGIAHVARGEDVDREPDRGPVRGPDDGDRAALELGDGGLEGLSERCDTCVAASDDLTYLAVHFLRAN